MWTMLAIEGGAAFAVAASLAAWARHDFRMPKRRGIAQ